MSALGQKQTCALQQSMSALPRADGNSGLLLGCLIDITYQHLTSENASSIQERVVGLAPNLAVPGVVKDGKAKYPGLHALRHFYASYCINRRADGGLELPIKTVQERMGHASITITSDVYGHLFPRTDDGKELAEAEQKLFAVS